MRFMSWISCIMLLAACKKDYPTLETEVYGHAGETLFNWQSKYPPNTLKSIEYAITELNVDGIEVDVQMTADNELVLYHDLELDDNSESSGCINDKQYAEVKTIKVYKSDETIPLLEDALSLVLSYDKKIMLDVKHHNSCKNQTIDIAAFHESLNQLISPLSDHQKKLITVNSRSFELVQQTSDSLLLKAFESDDYEKVFSLLETYDFDQLTTKLDSLTIEMRDKIRNKQLDLIIYNVKSRSEVRKALDYAPEFVISDNVEYTLKLLDG